MPPPTVNVSLVDLGNHLARCYPGPGNQRLGIFSQELDQRGDITIPTKPGNNLPNVAGELFKLFPVDPFRSQDLRRVGSVIHCLAILPSSGVALLQPL